MSPGALLAGFALGALGAGLWLGVTWWRARLAVSGRAGLVWLLLPVGIAAPVAAVLLSARIAPQSAWASVAGLVSVQLVALLRARSS